LSSILDTWTFTINPLGAAPTPTIDINSLLNAMFMIMILSVVVDMMSGVFEEVG